MRKHDTKPQRAPEQAKAHEETDIFVPGIMAFVLIMAFAALFIHAGLWAWLKTLHGSRSIDARPAFRLSADNFPHLQVSPEHDWKSFRTQEERLLQGYSWVDRAHGIVRIPITGAMGSVVARGMPHWGPTNRLISPLEMQQARAAEGELK
jgi:hypothetical protein